MNNNIILFVIDKGEEITIGKGALYSLLSIVLVFLILLIIIGITSLIYKMMGLFALKKELDETKEKAKKSYTSIAKIESSSTEIEDDDMMVAVLIASIDYQEEIKKDVRLVSVRKI